ncbi:hypothetical protein GDO78_016988 [Eleutherodactylus coqui]|uniref:Uncharacterized protein n=1 Tax=Eleutherodactylus coqui TaxID=57060 RepID=A0A8J6B676_ELECQ|nr:hypothetical protein GDO78_016988 [Eleutherodactylus coqui]
MFKGISYRQRKNDFELFLVKVQTDVNIFLRGIIKISGPREKVKLMNIL